MYALLLSIHVLLAVVLITLVLLQHGKGADIGAAFGSGASQTVFGSQGASSFLMKLTASLGAAFFATSLLLGHINAMAYNAAKHMIITSPVSSGEHGPLPRSVHQQGKKSANK